MAVFTLTINVGNHRILLLSVASLVYFHGCGHTAHDGFVVLKLEALALG